MRDHAKEMTIIRTEDGLATVPYWQHEYVRWKMHRTQSRLIGVAAVFGALALGSCLRALKK